MNHLPAIQDPIIENDLVVGWVMRVKGAHQGRVAEVEQRWMLPPEQPARSLHEWTPEELAAQLDACSRKHGMMDTLTARLTAPTEEG
ncbi:MAG TPA: hypothetical protein VD978_12145 [Azospirillum sp.]|nr:hypothetical protein [Azospirillum sp.]